VWETLPLNDAVRRSTLRALGIAVLSSLGALPTALLMAAGVLLGRHLDTTLDTSPLFVLGLLCFTIPLSMIALVLLARLAARTALYLNKEDHRIIATTASEEEDRS
jgi:hypothetical protein